MWLLRMLMLCSFKKGMNDKLVAEETNSWKAVFVDMSENINPIFFCFIDYVKKDARYRFLEA